MNRTPTVDIPLLSGPRRAIGRLVKDVKSEEELAGSPPAAEDIERRSRAGSRASQMSNRPTVRMEVEEEAAGKDAGMKRRGSRFSFRSVTGRREGLVKIEEGEGGYGGEEDWVFQHELDEHVNHLLTSRRERFKRGARGFWKFYTTPLGFITTTYFFLITFWGSAIFLFIIGWIPGTQGDSRRYWIEICDQILCALFTVVGIGLAPFRARDTYIMYHIVKYYRKSEKIRKARHLPKLTDKNELPSHNLDPEEEAPYYNKTDEIVLSPEDQEQLVYYQTKFHESHSFYRAHETATHYAFPIKLMVTIVLLLDFHSVFQSCLGGVTWGINYLDRPTWPPIFLISCSLSCSISAGVLIARGGSKTKKTEEVERRLRAALEKEALLQIQHKREREEQKRKEHEEALKVMDEAARATDEALLERERDHANGIHHGHHFWKK